MTVDPERMAEIAHETYVGAVHERFGDSGPRSLRTMLLTIRKLYENVAPERLDGTLVVVCPVSENAADCGSAPEPGTGGPVAQTVVTKLEHLAPALEPGERPTNKVLEIMDGGRFRLLLDVAAPDYRALSEHSIVYVIDESGERFHVAGEIREVVNPTRGAHASVYAIPTFRALEDALQDYRFRFARYCACPILAEVWESDARLVFKNQPEATMRQSMTQFLRVTLSGGATVAEEQNVDASHPVDIRVTWQLGWRIALLEIKWIGDSRTRTGRLLKYRDKRANTGAQQLAEYLEAQASQTPMHYRTGYLVVFDGRRRGLRPDTEALTVANAKFFAAKSVVYDPPLQELRTDFAMPVRMFMEPNQAKCIPS